MDGAVIDRRFVTIEIGKCVFHPILIVSVGTIFASMGTPRFFAVFRTRVLVVAQPGIVKPLLMLGNH